MVTKKRLSIDELIEKKKLELKSLEERKKAKKVVKLSKDSVGVQDLLVNLDKVASDNKVKVGDILILASKLKRTGLTITKKTTTKTK